MSLDSKLLQRMQERVPALISAQNVLAPEPSVENLHQYIDHTLLKPGAQREDFVRLCAEAEEHGFYSVCVPPNRVEFCRSRLSASTVKTITVVAFPQGYSLPCSKAEESRRAIEMGAQEVDMVLAYGRLQDEDYNYVFDDISSVVEAVGTTPLKVILESAALSLPNIAMASLLCVEAGASFVKTSTGFGPSGASLEAVGLMRRSVGERCGVKASGGIRNRDDALAMLKAGASRLGCSASVAIVGAASEDLVGDGY